MIASGNENKFTNITKIIYRKNGVVQNEISDVVIRKNNVSTNIQSIRIISVWFENSRGTLCWKANNGLSGNSFFLISFFNDKGVNQSPTWNDTLKHSSNYNYSSYNNKTITVVYAYVIPGSGARSNSYTFTASEIANTKKEIRIVV